MISVNLKAFLDMLAVSELGEQLIALSDNGYNVCVGSTPKHPILFHSYTDHPRLYNAETNSTAAGRYQLLMRYFDAYKAQLNLPDFSPASQDAIAIQQIRERRALDDIEDGYIEDAIGKVCKIWASLPGADYGQHENTMPDLLDVYEKAGGKVYSTPLEL